MEILSPAYYHSFRCLAAACPDSCCKEWAVQVDDATADRYRSLPGELGDSLRRALSIEGGDTVLLLASDRRCPMWQDDGLCRIQTELGEDWLCCTCRQFPRLRHDYGSFVELGLELSCPEAARLILSDSLQETVTEHFPGGDAPEYDTEVMTILRRSRETALHFLHDTNFPVGQALAVLLLYGHAVQHELDGGEEAALIPAALLDEARSLAAGGSMDKLLEFFSGLEILTPAWRMRLAQPAFAPWSEELRTMARYFIQRYWLQAVSDYDLISRVKLTVVSCLVVKALGGNIYETAQLYSKEVENNTDNLDAILVGAYTAPALTDLSLLSLLLS